MIITHPTKKTNTLIKQAPNTKQTMIKKQAVTNQQQQFKPQEYKTKSSNNKST